MKRLCRSVSGASPCVFKPSGRHMCGTGFRLEALGFRLEATAKQPTMLGGTLRGRWVVSALNGESRLVVRAVFE